MGVRFLTQKISKIGFKHNKCVNLVSNSLLKSRASPKNCFRLNNNSTNKFMNGNYTWYNVMFDIEPIVIKPKQFSDYQQLSDFLIDGLPKRTPTQKWIRLIKHQRDRIITTSQKKSNRCNWKAFLNAYGWKIVQSDQYQKIIKTKTLYHPKKSKIQCFLEKGDVTIMHLNKPIAAFYLPPNAYQPGKDLSLFLTSFLEKVGNYSKNLSSSTIYQGFCNLFIGNKCSYHGYYIVHGKLNSQELLKIPQLDQSLSQKVFDNSSLINFSQNSDDMFSTISEFYKTYFSTTTYEDWLSYLNSMKQELGNNIRFLSKKMLLVELENYPKFLSKADCENYLKTSNSFYHRTCYWFLQNPIDAPWYIQNQVYGETHHIFPVYLKKNYNLQGDIDQKFNRIYIPWFVHFFLHGLRFIEFQLVEDFKGAIIMYNKLIFAINKSTDNKTKNFEELDKYSLPKIVKGLKDYLKDQELQDQLFRDDRSKINAIKKMNPHVKTIYNNPMIWQNERYDIPDLK